MALSSSSTTLISKNTEIIGDVHFNGNLEIEGKVRGNVYATDAGDAHVRVLEKGCVEGEIRVPSVVINGTVTGDVHSAKHIELAAKASVSGNVHYNLIEMVKGAQVNGNLVYSGEGAKKPQPAASVKPATENKPAVAAPGQNT